MKTLLILLTAFFSLNLMASLNAVPGVFQTQDIELEAIFNDQATFKASADGFIHLEFDLSRELSNEELKEVEELSTENKERIEITVSGQSVQVKLVENLSTTNVWAKVFYTMGITQYTFGTGPDQINQPFDVFAGHFNLQ